MWKILLVEDETFARKVLRQSIHWEAHGFTIEGEASNGEEALHLMKEIRPDLIISDIAMPVMDGIELLSHVRQEGLDTEFIMLTCFSEFEYARHSLELGALQYILKGSMKATALEESLRKAAKVLARKADQRKNQERLQLHEHLLLYGRIWELFHGYFESERDREQALEEVRLLDFTPSVTVPLELYMTWQEGGTTDSSWLQTRLSEQTEGAEIHTFIRSGILTVFVWGGRPVTSRKEAWPRNRHLVFRLSHQQGSSLMETWAELLVKWDNLWYGDRPAPQRTQPPVDRLLSSMGLEWSQEREFIRSFEMSKIDGAIGMIREIWERMADRRLPVAVVLETAKRLDLIMSRITARPDSMQGSFPQAHSHMALLENMILRIRMHHTQWQQDMTKLTNHSEINRILMYIRDHYSEDITLKSLAQFVNMDEHYVSALFKKKMGETLIHYIQRTRIEQSKFYLKETDLPVGEICSRVGFANENYFFKLFKRWTGSTPNDFRSQ